MLPDVLRDIFTWTQPTRPGKRTVLGQKIIFFNRVLYNWARIQPKEYYIERYWVCFLTHCFGDFLSRCSRRFLFCFYCLAAPIIRERGEKGCWKGVERISQISPARPEILGEAALKISRRFPKIFERSEPTPKDPSLKILRNFGLFFPSHVLELCQSTFNFWLLFFQKFLGFT